jgi:acyl dehydratase
MPVQSDAVGAELGSRVTTVTARQVLAYAAGLGVDDPRTLDDTDTGLAALPQWCVSLEWPVVSSPDARRILGLEPEETPRGVHVGQDSTFHAPIRPGATVRSSGRLASVRSTSAGALVRVLLETVDEASGKPLVSTWSSSIYRGVAVAGPDRAIAAPPEVPGAGAQALGASAEEIVFPARRGFAHVYSECAAIWNPIHTERAVALRVGLPDIILHGTATWALAGLAVTARRAGGDASRLRRLAGRFAAPVLPDSVLRARVGAPLEPPSRQSRPPATCSPRMGVAFDVVVRREGEGDTTVLADGWAELT